MFRTALICIFVVGLFISAAVVSVILVDAYDDGQARGVMDPAR